MRRGLKHTLATAVIISATLLLGCSQRAPLEEMETEDAYRYLERLFDKGRYLDAADGLDFFTLNYSGSALVDSAQFLLARSHFELKEYLIAAHAFDELTRRFPRSPLVPDAMFMVGACHWKLSPRYSLDQAYTHKAIDALQTFIDYYPERRDKVGEAQELIGLCREKLARKGYTGGMIYLKMKDYQAATIYFQDVVDLFYDTEWAPQAAFQLGASLAGEGKTEEALEAYHNFLLKYPDHPLRPKAESALASLNRRSEG